MIRQCDDNDFDCTLTLFCRLPSLNLEKMGKIGAKVPISTREYLFICETRREIR